MNRLGVSLSVLGIRAYRRLLSPSLGSRCRFTPTCSHYTEEALVKHGFSAGWRLAFARFGRCNHRYQVAHDPVP